MKVKQVYVADDGQQFSAEEDCLNYEKSINSTEKLKEQTRSICALWNSSEWANPPLFIMNNYEAIKSIMEQVTQAEPPVEPEIDWSKVPEGTWIYVCDSLTEHFAKRKLVEYIQDSSYPFICYEKDDDDYYVIGWKYAQLTESDEQEES